MNAQLTAQEREQEDRHQARVKAAVLEHLPEIVRCAERGLYAHLLLGLPDPFSDDVLEHFDRLGWDGRFPAVLAVNATFAKIFAEQVGAAPDFLGSGPSRLNPRVFVWVDYWAWPTCCSVRQGAHLQAVS